jgi:hypothetical protein
VIPTCCYEDSYALSRQTAAYAPGPPGTLWILLDPVSCPRNTYTGRLSWNGAERLRVPSGAASAFASRLRRDKSGSAPSVQTNFRGTTPAQFSIADGGLFRREAASMESSVALTHDAVSTSGI